jgi:hypothetical protein
MAPLPDPEAQNNRSSAADFESQLARFMAGIRHVESGGNYTVRNKIGASGAYQFMPGTWRSWAGPRLASVYPEAYLAPPELQDEVARRAMTSYFQTFLGWDKVAKAWLGGPGSVDRVVSDGNVTNVEYAQRVLNSAGMMSAVPAAAPDMGPAADLQPATPGVTDYMDVMTQTFDRLAGQRQE